jgi:serine/threonine protein kinase/tetratricopeptide (TPR) repeat protein
MNPEAGALPTQAMPTDPLLELVGNALDLPPGERTAFLQAACGDNTALLSDACSIVEHARQAGEFLGEPAYVQATGEDFAGVDAGSLAPGTMLGEHRLLSLLGEGGMGEVYLAEDTKLERRVAVKLLKHRLDDASLARRFRHERKVLAALNHPNIARLYGGGTTPEGRSYLVMEYVEGERLDRFCERHALDVSERLVLFRKVCAAVAYAHQNLIVHRDLKPANIRVTAEGEPKLLDFGIAKLLDPEGGTGAPADLTVTLQGAMTPEYASPEQLKGEMITTASDVYSLGVVLYELLCGQRPYAALKSRRPDELVRAICEEEPPRPSTAAGKTVAPNTTAGALVGEAAVVRKRSAALRRLLEGDLDNIVAKALRKEPSRRYLGVSALSEDIRRHCAGLPVSARRDTLGYRSAKFVRRNKAGVIAATLVLLALIGGLVATAWEASVTRQERDRARIAQKQAERLNGFMQTLLGSVNPENGVGPDLKVVQVLDEASKGIDQELAADPAILAQAHLTIGQAYTNLKEAEPAIRHLRAAVDIDRRLYGNDNIVTARAEMALGVGLMTLERRYPEALPWLRAALAVERRQPVNDQGDLPQLFKYLGLTLSDAKHLEEASALAAESLAFTRKTYGEQSVPFAKGLQQLAFTRMNAGDNAGAEAPFRQALSIYRQLKPGTPAYANALSVLAYALILEGKLAEPPSLLQESLDCYRATVGENNSAYHVTLGLHGFLHFLHGDYPTAEADLRSALAFVRPLAPKTDEEVAGAMVALGLTLTCEGKAAEGETWLRESMDLSKTYHLHGMAAFYNVEAALGECLLAQKRYAEAEPLLLNGYALLSQRTGKQATGTIQSAARLHDLYIAWNKPEQAARFGNASAPPTSTP